MRVTLIGPAYPLRGGIAHHVYYLQQELAKRGHTVQVVSFRKLYPFRELYPANFFPGSTEFDSSGSKLDAGAISVLSFLNPISWARAFSIVKAFSPDVIVFQWWQPFFAPVLGTLARLFRWKGLKCVMECHNVFPHERSPFDRLLLKFASAPIDAFITHSTSERNDLLTVAPSKKISVSALPFPTEFSSGTKHARDGRTILFFGTVRKYKGLDVLLAAMPKVLSQIECRLVIAGEFYDSIDKYRQLIRDYGIEQHVYIDDRYIPNEEIAGIFDGVDLLVLPYLSASQSAVASISLANALPVIASRSGGLSEIVIENFNGLLFPVGDSEALADQITTYFGNNLGPVFANNMLSVVKAKRDGLGKLIEDIVQDLDAKSPTRRSRLREDNRAAKASDPPFFDNR